MYFIPRYINKNRGSINLDENKTGKNYIKQEVKKRSNQQWPVSRLLKWALSS